MDDWKESMALCILCDLTLSPLFVPAVYLIHALYCIIYSIGKSWKYCNTVYMQYFQLLPILQAFFAGACACPCLQNKNPSNTERILFCYQRCSCRYTPMHPSYSYISLYSIFHCLISSTRSLNVILLDRHKYSVVFATVP